MRRPRPIEGFSSAGRTGSDSREGLEEALGLAGKKNEGLRQKTERRGKEVLVIPLQPNRGSP